MSITGQKLFMASRLRSLTFVSDMKIDNRRQYLIATKQSAPMSEEKKGEGERERETERGERRPAENTN